ncbi:2Fe-2S iron-sulfur cluster-binding protein [Deinococcus peraridilitoris]|uniref:Ferredoxin n=1 Tax=Deinococcus peraridilitoris (strain DSM 19664 / LMG 22246 / CIP 109416 / KR-200) TaxID=937777 RepID=L0A451_DEIPD|nr:2Fe-2S iron-sulfur cluster-binding protein [Deinococcus peraridilitoris]AFZ67972.1 ferredoxin [Deinococcus peraridilitoris DSM 19664]
MPKLNVQGYGEFEVGASERLVLALERVGVDILHRCGGQARCTSCRVEFMEGEPERMTQAERSVLEAKGLLGQARLSCQMLCDHDMSLRPVQTVASSGLESGKTPAGQIEPEPVWDSGA